jgi:ribonuclease HII
LEIEHKLWRSGIRHVSGIDEVGRGSVAGPVMACAVIFKSDFFHPEVKDSKLLSRKKRNELKEVLCKQALTWSVGIASEREIDFFNIRIATFMAMRRALAGLSIKPDYVLVDGEAFGGGSTTIKGIIKGDNLSFTIAAASIIAKEIRDEYMEGISQTYPQYYLDKNKGYGSAEHLQAIQITGPSECHRKSFLTKYI